MKKAAILTSYQREYPKYDFYFESEKKLIQEFNDQGVELHYVSPHYYNEQKGEFSEHVLV